MGYLFPASYIFIYKHQYKLPNKMTEPPLGFSCFRDFVPSSFYLLIRSTASRRGNYFDGNTRFVQVTSMGNKNK